MGAMGTSSSPMRLPQHPMEHPTKSNGTLPWAYKSTFAMYHGPTNDLMCQTTGTIHRTMVSNGLAVAQSHGPNCFRIDVYHCPFHMPMGIPLSTWNHTVCYTEHPKRHMGHIFSPHTTMCIADMFTWDNQCALHGLRQNTHGTNFINMGHGQCSVDRYHGPWQCSHGDM
jgi:hypothetical protein